MPVHKQRRSGSIVVFLSMIGALGVVWLGMGYHFAGDFSGLSSYGTYGALVLREE